MIEYNKKKFGDLNFNFELRDKQQKAIHEIAQGKGCLAVMPTGYGKTIVGVCLAYYCKVEGKKLIICSPLKALNSEHYRSFSKYGFNVGISDSDNEFNLEKDTEDLDVIILTYEKNDAILRSVKKRTKLYTKEIGAVLIDEIHHIETEGRGANLESSILKIKKLYPDIPIVGLSATCGNPEEMAEWLGIKLIHATPEERPVPLKIRYYPFEEPTYSSGVPNYKAIQQVKKTMFKDIINEYEGQYIGFFTSRKRTRTYAAEMSKTRGFKSMVNKYNGCVYHNAGLKKDEREVAETMFKEGYLRGICATPTLAQGINLPARNVILADTEQYSALRGQEILDANRMQQTIGRAGRPGYDDIGYAHIIVPKRIYKEVRERIENPLIVESRIPENTKEIVLEWVVSKVATTPLELKKMALSSMGEIKLEKTIDWLLEKNFIYLQDGKFEASFIGRMTSLLYIHPETTLNFVRASNVVKEDSTLLETFVEFLNTREYTDIVVVRSEDGGKIEYARRYLRENGVKCNNEKLLKAFYLTFIDTIINKYNIKKNSLRFISRGDQWTLKKAGERFMSAASIICYEDHIEEKCYGLSKLIHLGKYQPKIVDLISVRGIGETYANRLLSANITKLTQFLSKDVIELSKILKCSVKRCESLKESAAESLKDSKRI